MFFKFLEEGFRDLLVLSPVLCLRPSMDIIPGAAEVELPPNKILKHMLAKKVLMQLFLQDFNTYK